ncbi:DUF5815 family protein [Halodesulfurarchaeum sp. HSR-GB]|uniref:DUF5815 family protein n=1 Tax=Halodesulfurarchaeum sp. HSR-GB TaxID=3074077 RepID=UPI002863D948|nr:DUF5815 family protein [Halodesulfurarchaeum sp. HSR-GB]MDR5655877.1 DUF5815 family protein [Halodesulfurarchaeum sp. HSR-GB]
MTAQPGVPNHESDAEIDLPCGEKKAVADLDLGMREFDCDCGETHAVVMDPHPPSRFLPEEVSDILAETIVTEGGEIEEFGTIPLMGLVMEAHPDRIVTHDASEDGTTGFAVAWIADFEARRLHEIVVETVIDLMQEAVENAEADSAAAKFTTELATFDVEEFVADYREQRDFEDEFDEPV